MMLGCNYHVLTSGLNNANSSHGLRGIPEYNVWAGMKDRTGNSNSAAYKNYGGRGIKVCDRWLSSFSNFIEDMGRRPSDKHTIERVDNDGNYEPRNCIWATRDVQSKNQRPKQLMYRGSVSVNQCGNYCGRVMVEGKQHSCGTYKNKKEAQAAIDKFIEVLNPTNKI